MLIRHFNMQIPDLIIHCLLFSAIVHEEAFFELGERRQAGVFADVQALHQPLPLPVLRHDGKARIQLVCNGSHLHRLSLIDHFTRMLRSHPHQALKNLAPSGAKQAVNPKHLTFFQIQAHIIQQPAAAGLGKF